MTLDNFDPTSKEVAHVTHPRITVFKSRGGRVIYVDAITIFHNFKQIVNDPK